VLFNFDNRFDTLNEITQDTSGPISFSFLNITNICGRCDCDNEGKRAHQVLDEGNCLVRVDFTKLKIAQGALSNVRKVQLDSTARTKKLPFAAKTDALPNGRVEFSGNFSVDLESSLTKDQAVSLAEKFAKDNFPELSGRLSLRDVGTRYTTRLEGPLQGKQVVSGYLLDFHIQLGGTPIWKDHLRVSICGDKIELVSVLCHSAVEKEKEQPLNKIQPLGIATAIEKAAKSFKKELGIDGKYEVLDAGLFFVDEEAFGQQPKRKDGELVLAWHLVVNPKVREGKVNGGLFHVWLNAETGEYLGKTRF
jgi:hypothetical protein